VLQRPYVVNRKETTLQLDDKKKQRAKGSGRRLLHGKTQKIKKEDIDNLVTDEMGNLLLLRYGEEKGLVEADGLSLGTVRTRGETHENKKESPKLPNFGEK